MHIFVLTATYELRVRRKIHLRDHPSRQSSICVTSASKLSLKGLGHELGGQIQSQMFIHLFLQTLLIVSANSAWIKHNNKIVGL